MLIAPNAPETELMQKLGIMLEEPGRSRMVERLFAATARQSQQVEKMWEEVLSCIRGA
jgi:hypothetical protein